MGNCNNDSSNTFFNFDALDSVSPVEEFDSDDDDDFDDLLDFDLEAENHRRREIQA